MLRTILQRHFGHRPDLAKIVNNVGWLTLDNLLRIGFGLIVGVWMARYLGPDGFGVISYATAFVSLFGILSTLGLQSIVVRDLVRHTEGESRTLGTALALQVGGSLLACGLAFLTVHWARPDDALVRMAVAILGSALVFKSSSAMSYWFEANVQSKYVVWATDFVFVVFVCIKLVLILSGAALMSFVWALFAETAASAIALLVVFSQKGPTLRSLSVSLERAVVLLKDSWPLMVSGIAVVIYMKIDLVMLGQMIGNEAVGVYSAASRISEVWYFIPTAIVASVFPALIEARKKHETQYLARLQKLYDLMVLLAIAIAVPMTFLSDILVILVFGEDYSNAGPVLAIHIWAALFVFLGVASGKWFVVENRQLLGLQRTVVGAAANVALNIVLIPEYGPVGAAWATVVAYALAGLFFDVVQPQTRGMFYMKLRSLNLVAGAKRISIEMKEPTR